MNRLPREEWEQRHGFSIGSSVLKAPAREAKMAYEKLELETMQKIKEKSFLISGEYISGVISGDGFFTVYIRKNEKTKRFIPRFDIRFGVTVGEKEKLMLEVVAYYFSDLKPYIAKSKKKASYAYVSHVEVIPRLLNHSQKYPILLFSKRKEKRT